MSLFTADEMAQDQADALSLMLDVVRIVRAAPIESRGPIDPETLQYPAQEPTVIYHGPCRMQVKVDINSNVVETSAGEHEWTYLTSQLQVPVDNCAPGIVAGDPAEVRVDDVAEILASAYDASLVNRLWNIAGPYRKSQPIYRRFRVREVVA